MNLLAFSPADPLSIEVVVLFLAVWAARERFYGTLSDRQNLVAVAIFALLLAGT
jgi:hypothetical protein